MDPSSFPLVESLTAPSAAVQEANRGAWEPLLEKFEASLRTVSSEGTDASISRHQGRGQLLARDRIALLLDEDSPFLELCPFAGFGEKDGSPAASLITGIGLVNERPCLIMSHIPTQSGGAWNEFTVLKIKRTMDISLENNMPLISLVQSAGVFLPQQFRVFHHVGSLFRDLAIRSDKGQASCAVVFGSSTAGGAYQPALSDYTIFVKEQAQVFLGGPPLVKMAIGEEIDSESLGGSSVHGEMTGLADSVATNEFEAIAEARRWVSTLAYTPSSPRRIDTILPPRYPATDLLSLVDPDIRKPLPMLEVVLRLVDDSRLQIFKPLYGPNLLTTFAHVHGFLVGIVANQTPVINPDEAGKGAQFIRTCNQHRTPIIFLHNVTGFMVGSHAEHTAIIKRGAQMVSAVSVSTVPHISLIIGASYGAGNYAMCGRTYKPRFMFTWPSGRCSVMGASQLSGVMAIVEGRRTGPGKEGDNQRKSEEQKKKEANAEARTEKLKQEVERDSECYRTSANLIDDGVIHPLDTRDVLGMCLEVTTDTPYEGSRSHRALARL